MRAHFRELPHPAGATGAGAAINVADFREKSVQCNMAAGTLTLEGSNDGSTWNDVGGGAISADALKSIPYTIKWLRINVSVDITTSVITFAGMESRTD